MFWGWKMLRNCWTTVFLFNVILATVREWCFWNKTNGKAMQRLIQALHHLWQSRSRCLSLLLHLLQASTHDENRSQIIRSYMQPRVSGVAGARCRRWPDDAGGCPRANGVRWKRRRQRGRGGDHHHHHGDCEEEAERKVVCPARLQAGSGCRDEPAEEEHTSPVSTSVICVRNTLAFH